MSLRSPVISVPNSFLNYSQFRFIGTRGSSSLSQITEKILMFSVYVFKRYITLPRGGDKQSVTTPSLLKLKNGQKRDICRRGGGQKNSKFFALRNV